MIHTSISGYGRGGSCATKKAYDLLIQCESGLLSVTGTPESPAKVGVSIANISAGMYAFSGILTALVQRGKTGHGDVLEVSMLEALPNGSRRNHSASSAIAVADDAMRPCVDEADRDPFHWCTTNPCA
ncbi:CoA transferase [Arthrobacter bambusae]|uniref:CoA transferase n=1 Tax=Arthrobacter bambusae TaxID=1338426 RepID=UPI0027D7A792|nr:CoA transferase [Arthrobacter bambusae]